MRPCYLGMRILCYQIQLFAFLLCSKSGLILLDNHAIMLPNFVTTKKCNTRRCTNNTSLQQNIGHCLLYLLGLPLQALLSLRLGPGSRTRSLSAILSIACAVLLPIQTKTGYYARIVLGGFNDLFCSKLCRHKIRMPSAIQSLPTP